MSRAWANLRWSLAYLISRAGTAAGRLLPTAVWYALSAPIADVCFLLARRPRRFLVENLRHVVGDAEAEATARRVFRNYARYVIDFYQLPSLGRSALNERIHFQDWQRLDAALTHGNGVVFVTLHMGQAELGAAGVAARGHPVNVIAERLSHGPMDAFIQGLRRKLGMKVIPAHKATFGLLRCLNRGEVLAMMFDAVLPGESVRVQFFGAPAEVSSAPARIALRTGARVLTAAVCRDPADPKKIVPLVDFDLSFTASGDEERDVVELSQAMAASFERFVRRFPDQWLSFHPVWPQTAVTQAGTAAVAKVARWKLWSLSAAFVLGEYLPRSLAYGLARAAGDLAWWWRDGTRRDVEANMRQVMGPDAHAESVRAEAREVFRNVARYYVDLIRLTHDEDRDVDLKHVRLHGFDRLTSVLAGGRGAIVATAHFGNPEMAGQVGSALGIDVVVLAEPLPPALSRIMTRIRSVFGPKYIDVSRHAIGESLRHLRRGGCVAIAADRDIQGNGTAVQFFGRPAKVPLGAAEMAARTGAVLIPGYCRRHGNSFDMYFEEPLPLVDTGRRKDDAIANTRALLARMEEWISRDPGQWMVLEPIWKTHPPRSPGPRSLPVRETVPTAAAGYNDP
jgi:KDO2-lipid IV(A) lauroyltransferase